MRPSLFAAAVVVLFLGACGDASAPAPVTEHAEAADAGQHSPFEHPDGGGVEPDAGAVRSDLTLHGIRLGIVGEEGKPLHIVVVSDATGEKVAVVDTTITGPETFTLPGVLVPGERYGLHLYVDMDEDEVCDPSHENGGDRGWSAGGILGQVDGTSVSFHTTWIDDEVCAHWD